MPKNLKICKFEMKSDFHDGVFPCLDFNLYFIIKETLKGLGVILFLNMHALEFIGINKI